MNWRNNWCCRFGNDGGARDSLYHEIAPSNPIITIIFFFAKLFLFWMLISFLFGLSFIYLFLNFMLSFIVYCLSFSWGICIAIHHTLHFMNWMDDDDDSVDRNRSLILCICAHTHMHGALERTYIFTFLFNLLK